MNRNKRLLCISVVFAAFFLSYSGQAFAELASCSKYQYINVKIAPEDTKNPRLEQFHGIDTGIHDSFIIQGPYNPTYICGIMLNEKLDWSTDSLAAAWAAKGTTIKKDGISIKEDLGENGNGWQLCSDEDCDSNDACRIDVGLIAASGPHCAPYGVSDEKEKSKNSHGAVMVFEQRYMEMASDNGDTSLSVSPTIYRPLYDLLCDAKGYWYACDKESCACVDDYSCGSTSEGKWDFCQYGCDPATGKCKSGEAVKDCSPAEVAVGESLGPFVDSCNIDVTLEGLDQGNNRVTLGPVTYGKDGQKDLLVVDCDGSEQVVTTEEDTGQGEKTCYVTCSGLFYEGNVLKPALEVCYRYPEPEEKEEPKPGPTTTTTTLSETPIPKKDIKPSPPVPVCKPYYEVMTVRGESSDTPEVKEPGECKYTETIEINRSDNCKKIGGDLKDENYKKIDIPVCKATGSVVEEMGKDVIGNPYDFEGERKRRGGVICDGGITDVGWNIQGDEIEISVESMSGANASGDYDDNCEYMVCLYKTNGERIKCGDGLTTQWYARAEEEVFQTNYSSMGLGQFLSLDTLLGWNIDDLGGNFQIELFSRLEGKQPETNIENQTFELCKEGFLTLCTANESEKQFWIFPTNVTKTVYWGVEGSEYSNLATKKEGTNETTWLLNNSRYLMMDLKTCMISDKYGTPNEIKYYTIANDPAYRIYVNESYGNETYYKKYLNMSLDSDYLYCYKTDLRNTSGCDEMNYNWYSFTGYNIDEIGRAYREDLKNWNKNQAVDELSTLDMGRSKVVPVYDPHPCSVSMDKDYYKEQDTITIAYTNTGIECSMALYPWSPDKSAGPVKEWTVYGSGTQNYTLKKEDAPGNYTIVLNCGECYVKDRAYVNVSIIQNVMSRVFTVSPFLEDIRNSLTWTETGDSTLYAGAGFDRYDRCALSCNASDTKFRLLSGCSNARGSDAVACSNCTDEGNCTVDSNGKCPGTKGDCWDQVCRIRSRNYALEAEPGKKGDSFHGVPYNGKCPAGFPKEPIQIDYYTRPADDAMWSVDAGALDQGQVATKCYLDGGVIATTTFDFNSLKDNGPLVDMVFVIDTSGSMDPTWGTLCDIIDQKVVNTLHDAGINLQHYIYGLDKIKKCAKGVIPLHEESWGPGLDWVWENHTGWREGAKRVVIAISDQDGEKGEDNPEWDETKQRSVAGHLISKNIIMNGLFVSGGDPKVQTEMATVSGLTGGITAPFGSAEAVAEKLIEIAKDIKKPVYVVASNATIYMNQTAPNVWVLYQNESQNVSVNVSKTKAKTSNEENPGEAAQTEELNLTVYPSLMIVETANMPFNITYVNITRNGSRYNITRVYVPNETGADYGKEFIVTSKLILNYTLLESAESFTVDLNNSYYTQVRRDIDYVACDYKTCGGGNYMNYTLAPNGRGNTASCGNISSKGEGSIKTYRQETQTEFLEKEYGEVDTLEVDAVSHQNVLCSTLDQLKIEGTFEEYYDPGGNLMIYSASDDPVKITITPDILSGFTFIVNDSAVAYSALYYPARHQLTRKESAPYSDWEWRSLIDKYGYQDQRFGFPEQCKKLCPALRCSCQPNDRLNASCIDFESGSSAKRTDCACVPQECYPDPCVSNRTYHEEEGSVVANGDYETGDLSFWSKTDVGGTADVVLSGHSGYMLKLKGGVQQVLANLSTNPYNKVCIEYALAEYSADGGINLTITVDGKDNSFEVWKNTEECPDCLGWNKKCFPADGYISKVKVESKTLAWIDNINYGKYYDYVGMSTYATVNLEYMDFIAKGWQSFGMLKTSAITHNANTYSFEVESLPRVYMDNRNFQIPKEKVAAILSELAAYSGQESSGEGLTELKKAFAENGVSLNKYVQVEDNNGNWRVINGKRNYDLYRDADGNIKVMGIGYEYATLSEDDYKNGYFVIKTFFKDLYIPMSPNVKQSRTGEDPICYDVDIKFRKPTVLTVDVSPSGYTLTPGTRVTATYTLTYYNGTPVPNQKVYVDLAGQDIWKLSPEGVYKDYMFSIQEIEDNAEQQEMLRNNLAALGYSDIAEKLADAQYSESAGNKLIITGKISATIEVVDGVCHMLVGNKDIVIGVADYFGSKLLVYENEENKLLAYTITDENGVAKCSFKPTGTTVGGSSPGGNTSSPSSASTGIHVVSIKSPLFSREFLLLGLILIFGVFSYRYFGNKKIDLFSWWRDFKGKK
ncbi:MAG: vWA domain-containing protein [Candidatus Altiarchaeia archaeon]